MAELSLIPKKNPAVRYVGESFGVLFRIGVIVLLGAAVFTAGLYLYRNFVKNNLARQKSVLEKLEIEFDPTSIAAWERLANSAAAGRAILKNHAKLSSVFSMLEENTLANVSFGTFAYSSEKNTMTLGGEAAGYADVSLQANIFEGLKDVSSATFGNLFLRESGAVGFTLNIIFK
ncbi:hypothetical protein A2926_00485 [Candidatus Giovannonibacteria bacterium RIFCSPLOWO2_01_FULL_44_40]|uniref:Uncharacterized protein n=1 Tax=Candidatus Giovannonibacteria bacterium RIFCSPHIGHO2_01_FULL_45_23 TaxID=1798325 RepID=A0A1F5VES5_9BACT|nr:MAG: hypothetical protein A2834_00500 [Candidatus Giovannonibacteria bacterium RIFCSPHIGHO2_01_FULL_45_23]OGF76521.1 MAG: hypothetical protein A3C77_03205 [Candidatus Giovannonibacteria bacterium RIFCSPHIGHO2_02_FULL_45_13]OGF79788.1 MAG: hypothetical protein A2926_00485 [Candidatus Giovannonibacteria bacterium RIFCSPLOWO2_01_FULL_44_40]